MAEDPHEVLGLLKGASLEQIRMAYHKAVLKCHPDMNPSDDASEAEFRRVTDAYQSLWRNWMRPEELKRYSPGDYARTQADWFIEPGQIGGKPANASVPGAQRITYARHNETRVFLLSWLAAMAVALVVAYFAAKAGVRFFKPESEGLYVLVLIGIPVLVYGAVVALTLWMLVNSRKIFWVVVQLGIHIRRALPGPHKLPRESKKFEKE